MTYAKHWKFSLNSNTQEAEAGESEVKANLVYTKSSRTIRATWEPVLVLMEEEEEMELICFV